MNKKEKREKRMYYISESEYIYLPLIVCQKTHAYYTAKRKNNQLQLVMIGK